MARSSAKKTKRESAPQRAVTNWPLLGIALCGVLLTAYLSFETLAGGEGMAFCTAGSSCDLVQSSHWSILFGIPLPLWGLVSYAVLAGLACARGVFYERIAVLLVATALLLSLYLNVVVYANLNAACIYCLASLALLVGAAGTLAARHWHVDAARFKGWLAQTVPVAVLVVIVAHLSYAGAFSPGGGREDPYLQALAEHLTATDAKFYGADYCPVCGEQKKLFRASADSLPYVECAPNGPNAPQATVCVTQRIVNYPTWIILGRRYDGLLAIERLAQLSRFTAPDG